MRAGYRRWPLRDRQIIATAKRIAWSYRKQLLPLGIRHDEAWPELLPRLVNAANKYDSARCEDFVVFLYYIGKRAMWEVLRKLRHRPILVTNTAPDSRVIHDGFAALDRADALTFSMLAMQVRDAGVVSQRLNGRTQEQIAADMGVTKARVQQLESRAIASGRNAVMREAHRVKVSHSELWSGI